MKTQEAINTAKEMFRRLNKQITNEEQKALVKLMASAHQLDEITGFKLDD